MTHEARQFQLFSSITLLSQFQLSFLPLFLSILDILTVLAHRLKFAHFPFVVLKLDKRLVTPVLEILCVSHHLEILMVAHSIHLHTLLLQIIDSLF